MNTLFVSMEHDELTVPSEQSEAKAELEILEHDEITKNVSDEIAERLEVVDEALVAVESLYAIHNRLRSSVANNESISVPAIQLANISTERICSILGYAHTNELHISTEAVALNQTEALNVAMEKTGGIISSIWEAIKNFFVRIWESIKGLWNRLIEASAKRLHYAEALKKRIQVIDSENMKVRKDADSYMGGKKSQLLKLQNAFRTDSSDVIKDNIITIINNHLGLTKIEIEEPIGRMNIEIPGQADRYITYNNMEIEKAYNSIDSIVKELGNKIYSNGTRITMPGADNDKKDVPIGKTLNDANKKSVDLSFSEYVLNTSIELINSNKKMLSNKKKLTEKLESIVGTITDFVSNTETVGTFTEEDKKKDEALLAGIKPLKEVMDLVYLDMPKLTLRCIDDTHDYIKLQLSLYVKDN